MSVRNTKNIPTILDDGEHNSSDKWDRQMGRWKRARSGRASDPGSAAFWNGLEIWEAYEAHTEYPGALLDAVLQEIDSNSSVLDIGAGTGAFTIPLARRAKSVTAVEPSSAQRDRLLRAVQAADLSNVSIVPKPWEKVTLEEAGRPDVVVAGYCLFMEKIRDALWKMMRSGRKRVFLIHLAGHDLQPLIREIRGSQATVPDYRLLLDVLKEMGLHAETTVFDRLFSLPIGLQLDMLRSAQGFTNPEVNAIKDLLHQHGQTQERNGSIWIDRHYRDALISIDIDSGPFP